MFDTTFSIYYCSFRHQLHACNFKHQQRKQTTQNQDMIYECNKKCKIAKISIKIVHNLIRKSQNFLKDKKMLELWQFFRASS